MDWAQEILMKKLVKLHVKNYLEKRDGVGG